MRPEKLLNIQFFITEKEEGKIECKVGAVTFIISREGKKIFTALKLCSEFCSFLW